MASLIEQIFAAMPLKAAAQAAEDGHKVNNIPVTTFQGAQLSRLLDYCWPLPEKDFKGTPVDALIPNVEGARDGNNPNIELWSYRQGGMPNQFESLTCRVISDGFRKYSVCDEIRFGRVLPPATFKDSVTVTVLGKTYELPLSPEFLLRTFRTASGLKNEAKRALQLSPGTKPVNFYPLEATYDCGTVHAFVYDLPLEVDTVENPDAPEWPELPVPAVGPSVPPHKVGSSFIQVTSPLAVTDSTANDVLTSNLDTATRLAVLPRREREVAKGGSDPVGNTLLFDDEWHPIPEEVWAQTNGPPAGVALLPARVLVLVSLTPCREKDDYTPAPGGIASLTGMARFFPQIVVKATIPLEHVDTAIRFTRPKRTTIEDGKPCGCDEMKDEIFMSLYADRNEITPLPEPLAVVVGGVVGAGASMGQTTTPNWSFIFNYRTREPTQFLGSLLTVVNPALTKVRALQDAVERNGKSSEITKLRRQASFDNIHCAPRMKFPPGTRVRQWLPGLPPQAHPDVALEDVEVKSGHSVDLLDVVMAPFCAHDCFHLHWRWTDSSVQEGQMGWSETAPFCRPGATMIPQHHKLQLLVEGNNQFVLVEEAQTAAAKPIPADTFEIFYSFGAAFAVSAWTLGAAAVREQVARSSPVYFVDPANPTERIDASNSWTAFYVKMQYFFEVAPLKPTQMSTDPRGLIASERLLQMVPLKKLMNL
jgi:hypothetical protein